MADENDSSRSSCKTCQICEDNNSRYNCPRCNLLYCSLDCYKSEKHIKCSESFYRDCVNQELAAGAADEGSKLKMMDILKKMYEDTGDEFTEDVSGTGDNESELSLDSDDLQEIDLQERIIGINLDDPNAVWNALTQDEQNDFEALVSSGDVSNVLPLWEPWWMYSEVEKLVQEVVEDEQQKTAYDKAMETCPKLRKVEDLLSLTKNQPAASVKYNIINVLASYAFLMRYFNGDVDPREMSIYLLVVSSNLNNNMNFNDKDEAVKSVIHNCFETALIETDEVSLEVMKQDLHMILKGPRKNNKTHYCKSALSHIHSLLKKALKLTNKSEPLTIPNEFAKKFPNYSYEHLPEIDSSKVKNSIKKIEYYLSYLQSYGMSNV